MTKLEILKEIDKIDCWLSPENLACDGELTGAQIKQKYNRLMAQRNQLEKQLGEKVEYMG
jgi:hypothetical protein